MADVLCFAYGSNMLPTRIGAPDRAPSARVVGIGMLEHHLLTFAKVGADGSGKCQVQASDHAQACVHGVIYALSERDLPALDRAEGGYERVELMVTQAAQRWRVQVYRALPDRLDPTRKPFDWYHTLVVSGAARARLPEDYLSMLRRQPVIVDPDPERRARHLALID